MEAIVKSFLDATDAWSVRITSKGIKHKELFLYFMHEYDYVICADEVSRSGVPHVHCFLARSGLSKTDIREFIREGYPDLSGNKNLTITPCKDYEQLIKYTLKEGKYATQGFTDDFIKKMYKLSFKADDFKYQKKLLMDKVILGDICYCEYVDEYIEIHKTHLKPFNFGQWKSHFAMVAYKLGEVELNTIKRYCDPFY